MPKLTSKRQVTIPQAICAKLGFEPGDTLRIYERDGVAHLVKMSSESLSGSVVYPQENAANLDTIDIKKAIKDKAAQKFRRQE